MRQITEALRAVLPREHDSRTLFFTQDSTASTCGGTNLSVTLAPPFTGQRVAPAVLTGGTLSFAVAYVTFDRDDLAHTSGTFDISEDGWEVHGKFDAPDCPQLD